MEANVIKSTENGNMISLTPLTQVCHRSEHHGTHGTRGTYGTHGTRGTYGIRGTHGTHSTRCTHGTHGNRGTHGTTRH